MAVQKEPILKKCRYLGISPAVLGVSKKESIRFKNANNRQKLSEYGLQLKAKQKLLKVRLKPHRQLQKPLKVKLRLLKKLLKLLVIWHLVMLMPLVHLLL